VVALAALAAAGPGRFGLAPLVRGRRARPVPPLPSHAAPHRASAGHLPGGGFFDEPIPPAGLPLIPLVRLNPVADRDRSSRPGE
jgi:hypothetical protein